MTLRTAARLLSDPSTPWHEWSAALSLVSARCHLAPPYTVPRVVAALREARRPLAPLSR